MCRVFRTFRTPMHASLHNFSFDTLELYARNSRSLRLNHAVKTLPRSHHSARSRPPQNQQHFPTNLIASPAPKFHQLRIRNVTHCVAFYVAFRRNTRFPKRFRYRFASRSGYSSTFALNRQSLPHLRRVVVSAIANNLHRLRNATAGTTALLW